MKPKNYWLEMWKYKMCEMWDQKGLCYGILCNECLYNYGAMVLNNET